MKKFTPEYPPFNVTRKKGIVTVENKFVKWVHDSACGGELAAAYVKNGSNTNLLVRPQSTSLGRWVRGGWRQYAMFDTVNAKACDFECETLSGGVARISYSSKLVNAEGMEMDGVKVFHTVDYRPCGAAGHTLKIVIDAPLELGHIRIGTLSVVNTVNRLAVRSCSEASWAAELQNPCAWIPLEHSKSRGDLPAYRSRFSAFGIAY